MIEKKTLREVTNNYYLFDYLIGKLDFITNANTHYLNSLYYDFQSGDKYISRFVDVILSKNNEEYLSENDLELISEDLVIMFGDTRKKLYTTLFKEYDALSPYKQEKNRTPNLLKEKNKTQNDTLERKESSELKTSNDNTSNNNIYGFNSVSDVPTEKNIATGMTTVSGDGEKNKTNTSNNTTITESDSETGIETTNITGNIGNKTYGELIDSEIMARKHKFFNIMFNDIDSILVLSCF